MKKYKLIKEYPGSPKFSQIALPYTDSKNAVVHYIVDRNDKKDCDYIAISKKHVEDNPDYWEEVEFYQEYLVSLTDMAFHNAWESRRVHGKNENTDTKKYFKSRAEAENFILYNKPCLSINDIGNNIPELTLERLIQTVKSKL